jgi:hypothetical protein
VPILDRDEAIRAAAGERIVAFARPGKPPEIPFVGRSGRFAGPRGSGKFAGGRNSF